MTAKNQFIAIQASIHENYHSYKFTIASLCESHNISRVTLHRILKTNTGQSASSYINEIRLQAAYSLLINPGMPIKEVAQKVGYIDPKYFSRIFKKKFDVTPSQIRDKN